MQSTSENKGETDFASRYAARAALACAILLGIAAERLLRYGPTGVGWVLWIALFGVCALMIVRHAGFGWQRETALAAAIAVAAALIPAVRASDELHALSMLVIVTAASVPLLQARTFRFGSIPVLPQLLGLPAVAAHAAFGVLPLVAHDARPAVLPTYFRRVPILTAARGVLMAVPPLVVFGALFASADPLFERYTRVILQVVSEDIIERICFALLFAWITAGLLRSLLPRRSPLSALPPVPTVPAADVAVALGAVSVLFTAFILVQARWLFDSADALQASTGLTVADYARRGFFELVAAAALTLPMLLAADSVARPASRALRHTLRFLTGFLIVLVLVIIASALERMALYTARFGLTEQRLYATAFMGWLALVFAWYVVTTLRGRRRRFAAGPVVAGIVAVLTLAVLNPDALIARVNLDRARDGATLDTAYLTHLSADAVPELIRHFETVPADARCDLARSLLRQHTDRSPDWRAANRSMVRASALIETNFATLKRVVVADCPQTASTDVS